MTNSLDRTRPPGWILYWLLACLANPEVGATAGDPHPGIRTSGTVEFAVTATTTLDLPRGSDGIDRIRLWHALPTRRTWSRPGSGAGATEIMPAAGGKLEHDLPSDSYHIYFEIPGAPRAGVRLAFETRFLVRSVEREFLPERCPVRWEDYRGPVPGRGSEIPREITRAAELIARRNAPADAVREFCLWIHRTVRYDASVTHASTDAGTTLERRRGHCGHQATILEQMCRAVGIPARPVHGMNLHEPDGIGALERVRSDFTNAHSWVEVQFPGIGWVEVDPGSGREAYRIPARYIQNNAWFQNYSIWIREDGRLRQPRWSHSRGRFASEDGVAHRIRFTVRKA